MNNEFCPAEFMAAYLSEGAYCFNAAQVLSILDLSEFTMDEVRTKEWTENAERLIPLIIQNYLGEFAATLKYDFTCGHTNGNVRKWHSDAEYVIPKQNATINCFYDDTNEETGGRFDITPYRDGLIGTMREDVQMCSIYPKKHSIIIFNQNRNWLHKATEVKGRRGMISIACAFHDFNPCYENFVQC